MSSGRSGGPSGRSGPEASTVSRASGAPASSGGKPALADLPVLPRNGEPTLTQSAKLRQATPPAGGASNQAPGAARRFHETAQRPAQAAPQARQAEEPIKRRVTARMTSAPASATAKSSTVKASTPRPDAPDQEPQRPHKQTLTQQLRSVQPPDVARQAINELNVLAGELITLAGELELSGLARIHGGAYLETARRYGELARLAWLSVAAERLEQDGATQEYRQRVVSIARDITHLRREGEVAASNTQFPLPPRRPYLWRTRVDAITRALDLWQASLTAPADPQRMGAALFDLRGALNGASAPAIEYSLLKTLTTAALWFTPLSGVAAGLASIANALSLHPVAATSFALVMLLAFMLWTSLLLLTSRGRVTLLETLAGTCFSKTRSACNGRGGSWAVAVALRLWWLLIGGVGSLLTLGALVGSALAIDQFQLLAPVLQGESLAPVSAIQLAAGLLGVVVAPAALVASAAIAALALPTFLVSAGRFARELGGSRRWVASARRYALAPALGTLAYLTGALVAGAWLLADRLHLPQMTLATHDIGNGLSPITLSARALLLALALALPYLAGIELPFRVGLESWRRVWLRDLHTRRVTIEAHVRRLSAPDPRTGIPDTSAETLRAMQYDLVLLQFYTARITEAERASSSPFGLAGSLALLGIVLLGALLLDGGGHMLVGTINLRPTP